jgi:hypothetical protein
VSGSLTLQYEKVLFLLRPSELTRSLARKRVTVHDFPDGRFEIRRQGQALPYLVFGKDRQVQQGSVVANKNLGTAMTAIKAKQARRGTIIAGSLAAWRRLRERRCRTALALFWPMRKRCKACKGKRERSRTARHAAQAPLVHPVTSLSVRNRDFSIGD